MIFKAALNNRAHPEYGDASIPFPIPSSEYDHTIEMLDAIGFGDALAQDCRVVEISSTYPILNRLVIQSGKGVVTPYGVVYDNGMKLEQVYDGNHFPEYFYAPCMASVTLFRWDQGGRETLYLPCSDLKIARTLRRLGVNDASQYAAVMESDNICDEVCDLFNEGFE